MFQHRWQVFNHSIPHLSYGLIIWHGSEHSSLLTLFPTTSKHKFFLTNQSNSVYKMLSNLAAQQQPVKSIHELTMNDIQTFMAEQFDPKRFVVRERFKFWSDMIRNANLAKLFLNWQAEYDKMQLRVIFNPLKIL